MSGSAGDLVVDEDMETVFEMRGLILNDYCKSFFLIRKYNKIGIPPTMKLLDLYGSIIGGITKMNFLETERTPTC